MAKQAKRPRSKAVSVGYGRPPRQHQFKPGHSGNPKGRPRGSRNAASIVRDLMARKIVIRESGKERKVSVYEAILLRFVQQALQADPKAATFLLKLHEQNAQEGSEQPDVLPESDQQILEEFARNIRKHTEGD